MKRSVSRGQLGREKLRVGSATDLMRTIIFAGKAVSAMSALLAEADWRPGSEPPAARSGLNGTGSGLSVVSVLRLVDLEGQTGHFGKINRRLPVPDHRDVAIDLPGPAHADDSGMNA